MSDQPDDRPRGRGFVPASDADAMAAFGEESPTNPAFIGWVFYRGLLDREHYLTLLRNVSAPDREDYWVDYRDAERRARATDGIGSGVDHTAPGVAYMKLFQNLEGDTALQADGDVLANGYIMTLVEDANGEWFVYSLGDYTLPEDIAQR